MNRTASRWIMLCLTVVLLAACGFSGFADYIATANISRRAAVNRPDVLTEVARGDFANCAIA
jgi:hypothetical protein